MNKTNCIVWNAGIIDLINCTFFCFKVEKIRNIITWDGNNHCYNTEQYALCSVGYTINYILKIPEICLSM